MNMKAILASKASVAPVTDNVPDENLVSGGPIAPTIVEDPNLDPANTPPEPEPEVLEPGPAGSYRPKRLQRFFCADGRKVEPIEGFFVPQNQEEYDMLEHYATQWDMVEKQGGGE